jgi:hypothetical protein
MRDAFYLPPRHRGESRYDSAVARHTAMTLVWMKNADWQLRIFSFRTVRIVVAATGH